MARRLYYLIYLLFCPAGSYNITVRDALGCSVNVPATIDFINSTLTANANVTNIACGQTTGSAIISASGGNPPYTYSLDGGVFGTASGFTGLNAGSHTVRVRDALGCTYDVSFTILPAPVPTAPTATLSQPTCQLATGTITVTQPAPAAGITYSIDGTTYTNTTGVFAGLAPATYHVASKNSAGYTRQLLALQ